MLILLENAGVGGVLLNGLFLVGGRGGELMLSAIIVGIARMRRGRYERGGCGGGVPGGE